MDTTQIATIHTALLSDRACLQISGEERAGFLQGLVSNDVETLAEGSARFAGLLSPQGKILFEFFVVNADGVLLLDCASGIAAELRKRLGFYKLRAKVGIEDVSALWRIGAVWGEGAAAFAEDAGALAYPDPRLPELGCRVLLGELDTLPAPEPSAGPIADFHAYEAMRIGLAVPEGGKDYAFGNTFPHDACFDLLHGVDFKKGCYVGQEVVSRMQHRGTGRTRVVGVLGETALPEGGADLTADGFAVGHLGSVAGKRGVALARLDRVNDALTNGQQILAGAVPVTLFAPAWAPYSLGGSPEEAAR
jgi:folate-binding protein YgfZ